MASATLPMDYKTPFGYAYKLYVEGKDEHSLYILDNYLKNANCSENTYEQALILCLTIMCEQRRSWTEMEEKLLHNYQGKIPDSIVVNWIITYLENSEFTKENYAQMINSLYRYQDAILKSELKDSILPKLVNCACSVQLTEPLKAILANSRGELENSLLLRIQAQEEELKMNLERSKTPDPSEDEGEFALTLKLQFSKVSRLINQGLTPLLSRLQLIDKKIKIVGAIFGIILLLFRLKKYISHSKKSAFSPQRWKFLLDQFLLAIS